MLLLLLLQHTALAQTLPATKSTEVLYPKTPPPRLKLDLYLPPPDTIKSPMPVLVRLSPTKESPARIANDLLAKGYALVYAAYLPSTAPRNMAFSPFPQDLFAAKAAIRWARGTAATNNFDPDRIAVWGAGRGATLAALLAVTADQDDLNGTLGDFPKESSAVRAACIFGGTTDWRNAELYGDETVNIPNSPAYQLFAGNPKDAPEDARRASAVNYIRPTSPPLLMITLASDSNRAMHLIFAETLKRAGVASALYEEHAGAGPGGRAVDESKLDRTILEFFADTLAPRHSAPGLPGDPKYIAPGSPGVTPAQEVQQLAAAGLYKQARRLIEEQIDLVQATQSGPSAREPWLKQLRQISDQQQTPAMNKLVDAMKAYKAHPDLAAYGDRPNWTIREILTDPDHIGEYHVAPAPSAHEYDRRAVALRDVDTLNIYVQLKDFAAADRQAAIMRSLADSNGPDPAILSEFLAKYADLRAHPGQAWPPNTKPIVYALASGQDLYGFWFTMRAGTITQRFRYIPPGKFAMGSSKDEWSRLPGEPILEPTEIKTGFWLADCPVTQDMWEGIMGGAVTNHSHFKGPRLPAENLSYAHAVNFLQKLGVDARLPTEAEYEYACRAGSTNMYPATGRLSDIAWFWDEAQTAPGASPDVRILHELETERGAGGAGGRSTHPVCQKLPNAWGLYDMQGNVWEWCSGTTPDKPQYHPARGGSWISIPQSCRAARSTWFDVEQESWHLGMRILIPAQ